MIRLLRFAIVLLSLLIGGCGSTSPQTAATVPPPGELRISEGRVYRSNGKEWKLVWPIETEECSVLRSVRVDHDGEFQICVQKWVTFHE